MARIKTPAHVAQWFRDLIGLILVLNVRATVDAASTAAEAVSETTVTATGALLGDVVLWGVAADAFATLNGSVTVYVTAADTITVKIANNVVAAGAAFDMASTAMEFTVLRRAA